MEENAVLRAAQAIKQADYLIIAAGAGFSADSGLPVYADVANHPAYKELGLTYADLCSTLTAVENPPLFYGFWGDCLRRYRETACHEGYNLLERWVSEKAQGHSYVYTSNVDGHFRRYSRLAENLHEIHGSIEEWLCLSNVAFFRDEEVSQRPTQTVSHHGC